MSETKSTTEQFCNDVRIQSQIDRLTKSLSCQRDRDIEVRLNFGNSPVGQEIEALRRVIGEQWSIVEKFKLKNFVKNLDRTLDNNRHNITLFRLLREREILSDELEELNNCLDVALQKQKQLSQELQSIKIENSVLEHLMKSTDDDNN